MPPSGSSLGTGGHSRASEGAWSLFPGSSVSLALGQTLEHEDEDEDMMRDYEVVD
jgi:hypothetical protein